MEIYFVINLSPLLGYRYATSASLLYSCYCMHTIEKQLLSVDVVNIQTKNPPLPIVKDPLQSGKP